MAAGPVGQPRCCASKGSGLITTGQTILTTGQTILGPPLDADQMIPGKFLAR